VKRRCAIPYTKTDWVNNQIITETLLDHVETQYEQALADALPRTGGTLTGQLTVQGNTSLQGNVALSATGTNNWKTLVGLILHRSRYVGTYFVIGDQQDILALANREPNRTFTASPTISGGSLNSVLTDDMAFATWNVGAVGPIVLTLDASANPLTGAGFSSLGFTYNENVGFAQPVSVKIEAFNSGAYETVYDGAVVMQDGFGYLHYSLMTGGKISGTILKLRVSFTFSPSTLSLPFALYRLMLYNEGSPFSPFYLHRLGGNIFGNVTVYGTLNATTLQQNGLPVGGGGGGGVSGGGTTNTLARWTAGAAVGDAAITENMTGPGWLTLSKFVKLNVGGQVLAGGFEVYGPTIAREGLSAGPDGAGVGLTVTARSNIAGRFHIDSLDAGDGTLTANGIPLFFGGTASGVGILSKKTSGGNQNGLDIFTGSTSRISITSGGNVGIGNSNPGVQLELGSGNFSIGNTSAYMVRDSTSTRRQIIKMSASNELQIGSIDPPTSNGAVSFRVNGNEYLRLEANGSVIQNTGAIATSATDGFMYVAGGAGTPTGTPTAISGRYPIYVDGTNNLWYFYSGGAWRTGGGGGGTDPTKLLKTGDTMTGNLVLDSGAADGADIQLASSGFTTWNLDNFSGDVRLHRAGTTYFTVTPTVFNIRQGVIMDNAAANTGGIDATALRFGGATGEGIASKRNSGGNQNGLDFYTASTARMQIAIGGNIGIGAAPATAYKLDVNGDQRVQGNSVVKGPQYDARAYGAVGDGKYVADASITSGAAILTSPEGAFVAADQGKPIAVMGAGSSGGMLTTTIQTYTSATQVTLAANASTTIAALASPAAPTLTPLVGSGTFGAGSYNYSISYTNARGETIPGTSAAVTVAASGRVQVTLPIGPAGTTGRRVYRSPSAGGGTGFAQQFLVQTVTDNSTTTWIDTGVQTGNYWPLKNTTGAAAAWGTDNTTLIQASIDAAYAVGGTALLPGAAGGYLCFGQLWVKTRTALHSGGKFSPSWGSHGPTKENGPQYQREAEIWTVAQAGNAGGAAFLELDEGAILSGITIFHPCQFRSSPPVVYPPTILFDPSRHNAALKDVLLVNPYYGVKADLAQNILIERVGMGALSTGIFMDRNFNTATVDGVHFGLSYWLEDDYVTNPLLAWTSANLTMMKVARVDELLMQNILGYGALTGILFQDVGSGGGRGNLSGIDLDYVNKGIWFQAGDPHGYHIYGLQVYAFQGSNPRAVHVTSGLVGKLKVYGGSLMAQATGGACVEIGSGVSGGTPSFEFIGVNFDSWGPSGSDAAVIISSNACYFQAIGCEFRQTTGYQFNLASLTAGQNNPRISAGNILNGGRRVNNTNNVMLHETGNWDSTLTGVSLGGATRLRANETTAVMELLDNGSTGGAGMRLIGNGVTTPTKTLRAYGGNLEIMNDAYSAAIASLTDAGTFNAVDFYKGGKPLALGVRVFNTGTVAVGHTSATPVPFPSEAFDNDNLHDTATNNSRITFTAAGKYIVGGCVWWQSGSTGIRQVAIRLNGGTELHNDRKSGNYPTDVVCQPTTVYQFSAGDYVELVCFQDSGASVNLDTVNPFSPSFWAMRVG
jgi:hypothetical protein